MGRTVGGGRECHRGQAGHRIIVGGRDKTFVWEVGLWTDYRYEYGEADVISVGWWGQDLIWK